MEEDNNGHKPKNWWFRFLKLKIKPQDIPSSSNKREPTNELTTTLSCIQTRNNIRRSLKRMHTQMKECMTCNKTAHKPIAMNPSTSSDDSIELPPPVPYRPTITTNTTNTNQEAPANHRIPTDEIQSLAKCYWYWGPMSTSDAEEKLKFKPDGAFLVRDSSSTSYLFTLSFRSVGKTMHTRIEYNKGGYSLNGTYSQEFPTITELVEHALKASENGIFCYSNRRQNECDFPVRLTKPLSRYTEVRSLKYLCKFVIRQCTSINDFKELPLPTVLQSYLLEGPYF